MQGCGAVDMGLGTSGLGSSGLYCGQALDGSCHSSTSKVPIGTCNHLVCNAW